MRRPDAAPRRARGAPCALAVLLAATPAVAAEPATVLGWPDGVVPHAPQNFRVTVYARGLAGPRSLLVLPNGDVLVTEARPAAARLTLLRDGRGDGVADQQFVLLAGLSQPQGLALRRDRLYIASGAAVLSCPYLVGQTRLHGQCRRLLELPVEGSGAQAAHGIAFSPDEARLYVGVGTATDAGSDAGADAAAQRNEPHAGRGAILVARPDGGGPRVYASSLVTPAGLAFEPHSGALWATLGAGEGPGEGAMPDCLTSVRDGGYYGRPPAAADFSLEAPGAPLGLTFYGREHFPRAYRGGAFLAQHGTRRGAELAGYKVVFVPFAAGRPAGAAQDFLTGFVRDAARGEVYGRPAGVAVASDGTLLVADDGGNTIWRVTFKCAACTPDPVNAAPRAPRAARSRSGP